MIATTAYRSRYATLHELHRDTGEGARSPWLSTAERSCFDTFRDPRRRGTWLAGRILLKSLILELAAAGRFDVPVVPAARLEIRSGKAAGHAGRPVALIDGCPWPWSLSISHSDRAVLVAVSEPTTGIGVDLVEPAVHVAGFARMWLTPREQSWLQAEQRPEAVTMVWGIKEAVYKAMNDGEAFRPRAIEVMPRDGCRQEFVCHYHGVDVARRCHVQLWNTPKGEIAIVAVAGSAARSDAAGEDHD